MLIGGGGGEGGGGLGGDWKKKSKNDMSNIVIQVGLTAAGALIFHNVITISLICGVCCVPSHVSVCDL